MSKKNCYIVCLLLGFYFFSCNKSATTPDLGYPIVDIDLNRAEKVNFDDWIDSVQLIPLESTKSSMIGLFQKMVKYDNNYYIYDYKQRAIIVFDSIGNFLTNSLSLKGAGPKEYVVMTDFNIDIKTGNITILDPSSMKLKEYDSKFNFLKNIPLPTLEAGSKFRKITEDIYLFWNYSSQNKELINVVSIKQGELIKRLYPLPEAEAKVILSTESFPLLSFNDCFYFTPHFPNTELYRFDTLNLELVKDIEYTIGGKEFSLNKLVKGKSEADYRNLIQSDENGNNYAYIMRKWIMEDCYYGYILYKEKCYINRFDKKSGEQKTIFARFNNEGGIGYPAFVDNDAMYFIISPEYVMRSVGENRIDSKRQEMINKAIEEDDNWWIVKYYMKK